jgi:putative acetyltransferase
MLIRNFNIGDEEAIWSVFYDSVHQIASANYTETQVNAWASKEVDPIVWAKHIQKLKPFVVEVEQQIVAYADLQADGLIDHFFVSPLFTRQGVGSLLMQQIRQKAAQQNLDRLFSHVSLTAKPFFTHWGFTVEKAQTVTIRNVQLNNFLMVKTLK